MEIDPIRNPELFLPESQASVVIGVAAFLMTGATTVVALRFYTRGRILHQLGADDWLSLGALFFTLATGISQCYMTRQGLGRHIGTLPKPDGFKNYMQNFYIVLIWYNIAIGLVKMTFLTQYYRVLATSRMRKTCVTAMVIIGSWSLVQLLLTIFICVPVAGFWDPTIEATRIPIIPEWYQNAAGNIITDIVIFCLPLPVLGRLNLPRSQKWVLLGIFSLGFFTCTISIIRIEYLKVELDGTWENVKPSLWSLCELCSGTTCACLPCLRPLASRWFPVLSNKYGKVYSQQPESKTNQSGALAKIDSGYAKTSLTKLAESDNDLIYGLEDSRSNTYSSSRGYDQDLELGKMRSAMLDLTSEHGLKKPIPAQVVCDRLATQTRTATRIGTSGTPDSMLEGRQGAGSVIYVKHDIVVHSSRSQT